MSALGQRNAIKAAASVKNIIEQIICEFSGKSNNVATRSKMNEELYRRLCLEIGNMSIDNFSVYVGNAVAEVVIQIGTHVFPVTFMLSTILQKEMNNSSFHDKTLTEVFNGIQEVQPVEKSQKNEEDPLDAYKRAMKTID